MSEPAPPARKTSWARRLLTIIVILIMLPVGFLASRSVMSSRPDSLGAVDGQLPGCPDSPNCVSTSAADAEHAIEPLTYDGSAVEARAQLESVVQAMPRTTIVASEDLYVPAEFTSLIFRYVDDVEFQIDDTGKQIQVRSASRTGYSDLGANRARVEAIRAAFNAAP